MRVCRFPQVQLDDDQTDIPVTNYYDTIADRRVVSNVEPGYLRKLLPEGPPEEGEPWSEIQKDIESKIMPGLTHWYSSPLALHYLPSLGMNIRSRTQAIPQLHGLLPRQRHLPFHARRALLRRLHRPSLQLDL